MEWGESGPGVMPTVLAGMHGGQSPVHGEGEEGGAATLSEQSQDQSEDEDGIGEEDSSQSLVPQGTWTGEGRVSPGGHFNLVLNSWEIVDAVRTSRSTMTAASIAHNLGRLYDCSCFTHEELLDRLHMLLYFRWMYESVIRCRCEAGLRQGLSPEELCQSVYDAFDRAE